MGSSLFARRRVGAGLYYGLNLKTNLSTRGFWPGVVSVVGLTGIKLGFLLLRYSVVCTGESLSLYFSFFILDLFVLKN